MENALDWNISRQIVWGIPIPAWICDTCEGYAVNGSDVAPKCETCNADMRPDTDTFDTWFSSGQWPLITTGYSNTGENGPDFNTFYPTDVLESGRDLVFKWIPRMIIFGLYLSKKSPFHTVYLHGLVNDANGKKMSKSKGNVISPLELTDKYGTDALRMSLVVGNTPGTDLSLREDKVKGYKHFANKLWNIARFVFENTEGLEIDALAEGGLNAADIAFLHEFQELAEDVTKDMEEYRPYLAAEKIYHYVWHRFADELLEQSKPIIGAFDATAPDEDAKRSRQTLLRTLLSGSLKLLHPFMPFVTEEIWQSMPETNEMLMVSKWPVL